MNAVRRYEPAAHQSQLIQVGDRRPAALAQHPLHVLPRLRQVRVHAQPVPARELRYGPEHVLAAAVGRVRPEGQLHPAPGLLPDHGQVVPHAPRAPPALLLHVLDPVHEGEGQDRPRGDLAQDPEHRLHVVEVNERGDSGGQLLRDAHQASQVYRLLVHLRLYAPHALQPRVEGEPVTEAPEERHRRVRVAVHEPRQDGDPAQVHAVEPREVHVLPAPHLQHPAVLHQYGRVLDPPPARVGERQPGQKRRPRSAHGR